MVNIREFDAVGDGSVNDTEAIQTAIDTASSGDGEIFIPAGVYLTGTLFLKSNIHIHLSNSAVLLGSPDIECYSEKTHYNRYANEHFLDKCLIFAQGEKNIRISGGTIDGNGQFFYEEGKPDIVHPMLFRFLQCSNIKMEDVTIRNPAGWSTAFIECERVQIHRVNITSRHFNGDGLDFDSCCDVSVSDCMLDTSDDSLCIQNSVAQRISRHIVVNNCIMKSKWAAVRIGLLNSGDIKDVIISNCIFHDLSCSGFKIQAAESGGIHNILISNILMRNVTRPVFITSNYCRMGLQEDGALNAEKGIDGIYFQNLVVESDEIMAPDPMAGFIILGTPERIIRNISFDYIKYKAPGGWSKKVETVQELENKRPEFFSVGQVGASAFYARHVEKIELQRFTYEFLKEDVRPPIVIEDSNISGCDSRSTV